MAQNIYDDAHFFDAYRALKRSRDGLDGAPEWPRLRAMLPDLKAARVLDLGCGFGWFCRFAREQGAAQILGIDISEKMLGVARQMTTDPAINYRRADLDDLQLDHSAFDLVYASLVFHYLEHLDGVIAAIHRALRPGGHLVFSVEHPMFTAPSQPEWIDTDNGKKAWPVNRYLDEGPRETNWLAQGVIKQHRTFATYLNLLVQQGFQISQIEEWGPSDAQLAAMPALAEERDRPTFLLIAAQRSLRD